MTVSARRVASHQDTAAPIPQPLAIDGIVVNDFANRTLFVKLGDTVTGAPRVAWTNGYQALQLAEDAGYPVRGAPALWARFEGDDRVARATPGDLFSLKFECPPAEGSAYSRMISKPGLRARVLYDRSMQWFTSVKFRHAP